MLESESEALLAVQPVVVQTRPGWRLSVIAVSLALLGGAFGIVGAFFQELQAGIGLGAILAAPIVEEALKPAGIYVLLVRWPQALQGQFDTAVLTALSGLCFGIIESLVYVFVYYPHSSSDFVLVRFTVTPLLHLTCSFIVGLGLSRGLIEWANGTSPMPKRTRNCYVIAALIHATYNTTVIVLTLTASFRWT